MSSLRCGSAATMGCRSRCAVGATTWPVAGVCDDGLVIDLSPMNGIRVDPERGTVRADGGVTIGELDHETQAFGLAVPMGVVTATGIAGLTLGGGLGWLRRRHGLSCDNLISADLVTADGHLVTARRAAQPGVVVGPAGRWRELRRGHLLRVPGAPARAADVPGIRRACRQDAAAALRYYRDWAASAPDEVSSFAILWHGPELEEIPVEHHHAPIAVYLAVHCGEHDQAEQDLKPLREFGSPMADLSAPMRYLDVQEFFDADYPATTCATTGSRTSCASCPTRP